MLSKRLLAIGYCLLTTCFSLFAADWLTFGGDPQRTGWAQSETFLTKETVPKMKLLWATRLDNQPRLMNGLTAAVVKEIMLIPTEDKSGAIKAGMFDIVVVAGSSDNVYALNADNGKLIKKRTLAINTPRPQRFDWICSQSLNATPVIEDKDFETKIVYVLASDGRLHSLNVATLNDESAPVQFVPPFSRNWSLNLFDGKIYTATSQGCTDDNSDKPAIYSLDLKSPDRPVIVSPVTKNWGGGIWGRAGVVIGQNGKIYTETGDGPCENVNSNYASTVLSLSRELQTPDFFRPTNCDWLRVRDLDMGSISPVTFNFRGKLLVAASGKEGVIYLLDADSLGGQDHQTPLFRSPVYSNSREEPLFGGHGMWGAISTWQDDSGGRWLYLPSWGPTAEDAPQFKIENGQVVHGTVMAFKVESDEKTQKPRLAPAWTSRDMQVPEPVVIANGMVFALSNGANVEQLNEKGKIRQDRHKKPAGNAVLYALDAQTGRELWSSRDAIKDWTHFNGLALANGKVFVTTRNGYVYAFGLDLKNQ